MKVHSLFETEQESAEREAVMDCKLYRGVLDHIDTPGIFKMTIKQDRPPRHANLTSHIVFNAFFEMVHGVKDVRSRSMFCTTVKEDTKPYTKGKDGIGAVLRVFPLKTSQAAYLPNVRDSYTYIDAIGSTFMNRIMDLFENDPFSDNTRRRVLRNLLQDNIQAPALNCLDKINALIEGLTDACRTDQERQKVAELVDDIKFRFQRYQVVPASSLNDSIGNVELMIFDASYYYAQVITPATIDDDDIPY